MDIKVYDHLIMAGEETFLSFADEGLI